MGNTGSVVNLITQVTKNTLERGIVDKNKNKVEGRSHYYNLNEISEILKVRIKTSTDALGPLNTRVLDPNVKSHAIIDYDKIDLHHLKAVLKQEVASSIYVIQDSMEFLKLLEDLHDVGIKTSVDFLNVILNSIDNTITPESIVKTGAFLSKKYSSKNDELFVLNIVGTVQPDFINFSKKSVQNYYIAVVASGFLETLSIDSNAKIIINHLVSSYLKKTETTDRTIFLFIYIAMLFLITIAIVQILNIWNQKGIISF